MISLFFFTLSIFLVANNKSPKGSVAPIITGPSKMDQIQQATIKTKQVIVMKNQLIAPKISKLILQKDIKLKKPDMLINISGNQESRISVTNLLLICNPKLI